jgi:hypothetical protein
LAVIAALDECNVRALQGEVAEGADTVDPAADDEHLGAGAFAQGIDDRTWGMARGHGILLKLWGLHHCVNG